MGPRKSWFDRIVKKYNSEQVIMKSDFIILVIFIVPAIVGGGAGLSVEYNAQMS